ncbi:MAG: uroporphyrinogen decarboxylase family protein [Opitutaceae bacterium]|nr:uroporphyrinogen decarboxylase family protein [Opitutaceae bacterium]
MKKSIPKLRGIVEAVSAHQPTPALTPRERFIAALERRPRPGRVPHFELVFFLTMEAFGKVHPGQRNYAQWDQMSDRERRLHIDDLADVYLRTAERYDHDAIFLHTDPRAPNQMRPLIDAIRERTGDRYFLMCHGDPTFAIPDGAGMEQLSIRLYEDQEGLQREARERLQQSLALAETYRAHGGLDAFALCSDYCFNTGPFMPPAMFAEFVAPYLAEVIAGYRALGFYTIKHTDGNILPIVDQLVQCHPHALHSLDPQAGVDIAQIVDRYADQVCLCGNVNCGLLQTGTEAEAIASARYALKHGRRAPGYIFCTSNCIYTGMPLERYELILDIWRKEGMRAN